MKTTKIVSNKSSNATFDHIGNKIRSQTVDQISNKVFKQVVLKQVWDDLDENH